VTYHAQGKYVVLALKLESSPPALCTQIRILAALGDALLHTGVSGFTHELDHCWGPTEQGRGEKGEQNGSAGDKNHRTRVI